MVGLPGGPLRQPGGTVTLLAIDDLRVSFHRPGRPPVEAVAGASLELERGSILGLVGESGCGKSTLAKATVGLVPRAGGHVLLDGADLPPLRRRARGRRERRLQMVFQDPYSSLNPRRRIKAQIADGLRGIVPAEQHDERIGGLLEQVGIPARAMERYPHEFSGGQRQRIAIARALAPEPDVLIADEIVSALDASTQAQVANLLVDLVADMGLALLFISHDLGIVRHIADRVAVMYLGRIVEEGPTDAVWDEPLHPYTRALVRAVPHHLSGGGLPEELPGEVPDPAKPPPGCRFHPRCPFVFDRCHVDDPHRFGVTDGRSAACWLQPQGGPAVSLDQRVAS